MAFALTFLNDIVGADVIEPTEIVRHWSRVCGARSATRSGRNEFQPM
jgi:hypothetical protein